MRFGFVVLKLRPKPCRGDEPTVLVVLVVERTAALIRLRTCSLQLSQAMVVDDWV